ncbi:hypothetical protein [Methylobacterium sp. ID0610]|uniref:hypothetical protein n=1 Tax=Methylobacterium carpenticola TaxID=3344827 RepID=UPI00368280A6
MIRPVPISAAVPVAVAASTAVASAAWRRFAWIVLGTAVAAGLAVFAFVAAMDPYGLRAAPGRAPGPIMDLNQRYMYPQIVRGGSYDAAVFGTSTARLLDPRALDRVFGGRFANLAMNAATPWEQTQLARLFLARGRASAMILGIDASWCDPQADAKRLTFRSFPPWLYRADAAWRGLVAQWNLQSVQIAGRVLLHRLGRMRERIRGDGYEVFTPPEASYDPARASAHIRAMAEAQAPLPGGTAFPALEWLDGLLAAPPAAALRLVAFMPAHVAIQPRPGSPEAAQEAACKAQVAAIGRRRGATVVDFRIASPVTTQDVHYWDALHYRLPIADRVLQGLRRAVDTGADDPDGVYRVLAHPAAG